jgi:hypothetical protein
MPLEDSSQSCRWKEELLKRLVFYGKFFDELKVQHIEKFSKKKHYMYACQIKITC